MKSIKLPFGIVLWHKTQQTGVVVPWLFLFLSPLHPPAPMAARRALPYTHPGLRPTFDGFSTTLLCFKRGEGWVGNTRPSSGRISQLPRRQLLWTAIYWCRRMGDASVTVFKPELPTGLSFRLALPIRLNRLGLSWKILPMPGDLSLSMEPGEYKSPQAQAQLLFEAPCRVRGRRTSGIVYFGCHVIVINKAKKQHVLALSQLWTPAK